MSKQQHLPISSLEEQIKRDLAAASAQVEAAPVERIRTSGKGFTLPDGETGQTIVGVIIDFVSANMYYKDEYQSDNPAPPVCTAVGRIPAHLAPGPEVPEPQADSCAVCPQNRFESGHGRSKACKNTRQIAFMQENANEDSPIWALSVPPGSIRYFDTYVSTTLRGRYALPPIAVVTEVSMDPNKSFAAPRFKFKRALDEGELAGYYARKEEAARLLLQGHDDR